MTDKQKTAIQWCADLMECYERERGDYDSEDMIHEAMCCIALVHAQLSATAPADRNMVLEEAAQLMEAMNDSAGDSSIYDQRDMNQWEQGSKAALQDATRRLRGLKFAAPAQTAPSDALNLLRTIVDGDVGRQTLAKLSAGQSTETIEGKAWLAAKSLLDAAPAPTAPDRHALQAEGKHPAPCARFCEANAFYLGERQLKRRIAQLEAQLTGK